MEEIDLWQYERQALGEGHVHICGCDEAGAGPLPSDPPEQMEPEDGEEV